MADLHPLSGTLTNFKSVYDSSFSSMESKQGEISASLNDISNALDSAISGFSSASSDAQCSDLKACIQLAKDGVERVKTHVDGDLPPLFANAEEVRGDDSGTEIIGEIVKLINDGKNWKESFWEKIWNATIGSFKEEWRQNDQAKIDSANKRIDQLNAKGEAQLNAMSSAINSVAFGVAGTMTHGGSLGASIMYGDNYNFNSAEWDAAHPTYHLNMFQQVGCAVVGAVEGVANVVEGVVDAGATLVAGVVSIFNKDAGQSIANWAATDYSEKLASGLMDATSGITGISGDAYLASGGRSLGRTAGGLVAHGALWLTGGGAIISAVSVAGDNMELNLQQGNGIGKSILSGTVTGVATYALGKVGQAAASKFATWANGSQSVVAKAYNAVANAIKTPVSEASGIGGKVASAVAAPLRWMGNAMQGGAKLINGTVGNTSAFKALTSADLKASAAATEIVDGVTGIFHHGGGANPPTNGGGAGSQSSGSGSNQLPDGSGSNPPPNGGESQPDTSKGMYGKTTNMTYNQAEQNLAEMDKYDILYAFDDPEDIARAESLWQESTATVADSVYGKNGATLKQGGNWYQNAENAARYYGSNGVNNQPDAWDKFVDSVYKIGRLPEPLSGSGTTLPAVQPQPQPQPQPHTAPQPQPQPQGTQSQGSNLSGIVGAVISEERTH